MQWQAILAFAAAYLLGSVDFGAVLPRLAGVDIYAQGSGNPGTSNVLRTMGRGWATAVLIGDAAKGLLAALIADVWVGGATGYAAMFAAIGGHCYPLWHGFRGGKGVATAGGALLWLNPVLGVAGALVWGAVVAATRVASIASLTVIAALLPAALLAGVRGWSLAWLGAAAILVVYRHKGNIARLLRGAERTVRS